MAYKLPNLPYDYSDLEPYIDAETVKIHHTKHHQGYVNKLNNILQGREELLKLSVDQLIKRSEDIPDDIKQGVINFAGGHANHSLYWNNVSPKNIDSSPKGKILEAINSGFDNFDKFKEIFKEKAMGVFGSGWAFLVIIESGGLEITRQSFQNSPLIYGQIPLLTIDVWEHAYYLKYKNNRKDYVDAFLKLLNWQDIEQRFLATMK